MMTSPTLECFCGRTYTNSIDLQEHREARGHFPSHRCNIYCNHPPVNHSQVGIQKCDECGKICERQDILNDHLIVTKHLFCSACDLSFKDRDALETHRNAGLHASEFRCCDCDITFKNADALNAHMARRAHWKPPPDKPAKKPSKTKKTATVVVKDKACTKCSRTFSSSEALQQHLKSIIHKPLSDLSCPLGKGCRGNFTAPSALVNHLESGHCNSGVDRDHVYHMIQLHDRDRSIHNVPTLTPSSSSACPMSCPSPCSDMPSGGSMDWSLVSTSLSQIQATPSWSSLSSLNDSLLMSTPESLDEDLIKYTLRCPLCPKKRRPFATMISLQHHLNSPAHGEKLYHCPSIIRQSGLDKGKKSGKKERQFTTLGGLAQHLESGACYGGEKTFKHCIDLIQQQLKQYNLGSIRVLLPSQ